MNKIALLLVRQKHAVRSIPSLWCALSDTAYEVLKIRLAKEASCNDSLPGLKCKSYSKIFKYKVSTENLLYVIFDIFIGDHPTTVTRLLIAEESLNLS